MNTAAYGCAKALNTQSTQQIPERNRANLMNQPELEPLLQLGLPNSVFELLAQQRSDNAAAVRTTDDSHALSASIGRPGYAPPNPAVLTDAVTALALGKNVLLKGPTGSGKTKLAEHLSYLFHLPMHSVNCSVDLDLESLLGFKTLSHHSGQPEIDYVEGPVVSAMRQGHLLYIDEVNMAKPETLPVINGVLDYRRRLTNPLTGTVITAHPGFRVIAAVNLGYVGTLPMNEALKNRFIAIDVPYVQGEPLRELLRQISLLKDDKLLDAFVQLSSDLVAQVGLGLIPDEAASIRALVDACDLAVYLPPMRAVERAIVDKLEEDRERLAVRNVAETLFSGA